MGPATKKVEATSYSPLTCLPNDLLVEISAKVASSELGSLMNLKSSCKEFYEICTEDNRVYQRVSLENQPAAVEWKQSPYASKFRRRCEESRNPEALLKLAMVEYFSYENTKTSEQLLREASATGHLEATYVLAVILISQPDSRREGVELLSRIETGKIDFCHQRSKKILHEIIWGNARLPELPRQCVDSSCRNRGKNGHLRRGAWEEKKEDFCSELCRGFNYYNLFVET